MLLYPYFINRLFYTLSEYNLNGIINNINNINNYKKIDIKLIH